MQIREPVVNKFFTRMNGLQRTAESFRYIILCFEWWIAPGGEARKWVKSNARVAAFLAAPTFLVLPVAVAALRELSSCVNALTAIVSKLVFLPVLTLLAVISISFVCRVLKR